ncbi:MAG: hypothetical protein ACK5PZ_04025, partial [Pirellula sp.]
SVVIAFNIPALERCITPKQRWETNLSGDKIFRKPAIAKFVGNDGASTQYPMAVVNILAAKSRCNL